jgi:ABC-2 type transport system ATP-binding protein
MTGREILHMVARLVGLSRRQAAVSTDAVLAQLDLTDVADRLVKTYSGGLRRRLDLGASLVGTPRPLLLDEPTIGLDPPSRNQLWEAIRDLVAQGTDVLLTTQYLDEADQFASQVAIIDHGRVIAHGTPAELKALAGSDMIEVRAHLSADLPALARAIAPIGSDQPRIDAGTSRVTVPVAGGRSAITAAVQALGGLDIDVDDIGLRRPTLDEVFLKLTRAPSRPDDGAGPESATERAGATGARRHEEKKDTRSCGERMYLRSVRTATAETVAPTPALRALRAGRLRTWPASSWAGTRSCCLSAGRRRIPRSRPGHE